MWADGARGSRRGALDEEVGDVHGIGQSLKGARRHAANGSDQSQDTAVHQLTGWVEGRERRRKDKRGTCYFAKPT